VALEVLAGGLEASSLVARCASAGPHNGGSEPMPHSGSRGVNSSRPHEAREGGRGATPCDWNEALGSDVWTRPARSGRNCTKRHFRRPWKRTEPWRPS